jgi:hypothetical protein
MRRLLPDPTLKAAAPSTARITVLLQPDLSRMICHVLHYIPERRTKGGQGGWDSDIDIIEDVIPLHDVGLEIKVSKPAKRVTLVPQESDLPFTQNGGYVRTSIPRVNGYQAVAIEY